VFLNHKWLLTAAVLGAGAWVLNMSIGNKGQENQRLALARTIYGEARGEGVAGMQAVAQVIVNRVHSGRWFGGRNVVDVVLRPWQFSTWNANDPNREKIDSLMPNEGNRKFDEAYAIAGDALAGDLPDLVGNSTHYHANYVAPDWAENQTPDFRVGSHLFYEGIA